MLNGGPVLNYITKLNDRSKIFLTGYQVEGTNGSKLLNGQQIKIDESKYLVKTPWVYYDFSAHCGKSDHYKYVKQSNPEMVVCVHGDNASTEDFAENLKLEGFKAYAPKIGETLKIDF
jgi:putative mRNA 3-end processing factor